MLRHGPSPRRFLLYRFFVVSAVGVVNWIQDWINHIWSVQSPERIELGEVRVQRMKIKADIKLAHQRLTTSLFVMITWDVWFCIWRMFREEHHSNVGNLANS